MPKKPVCCDTCKHNGSQDDRPPCSACIGEPYSEWEPRCERCIELKAHLKGAIHYIVGLRSPEMLGSTTIEEHKAQSIMFTDRVDKALKG